MSAEQEQVQKKFKKKFLTRKRCLTACMLIILLSISSLFLAHYIISNLFFPDEYRNIVKKYAVEYDLDPLLVSAVIYTESHYDPSVISPKGAVGLMQVLPSTAEFVMRRKTKQKYSVSSLKDPETNIMIGCLYLRVMLDKHQDHVITALAAYNAGGKNVIRWKKVGKEKDFQQVLNDHGFTETKNYVYNVLKIHRTLSKLNLIKSL